MLREVELEPPGQVELPVLDGIDLFELWYIQGTPERIGKCSLGCGVSCQVLVAGRRVLRVTVDFAAINNSSVLFGGERSRAVFPFVLDCLSSVLVPNSDALDLFADSRRSSSDAGLGERAARGGAGHRTYQAKYDEGVINRQKPFHVL